MKPIIINKNNGVYDTFLLIVNNVIIGNINFYLSSGKTRQNKIITILYLKIKTNYRNKGYAKYLLLHTLKYAFDNMMCYVELDDVSDNYRCKNNIYLLIGLEYVHDYGPEMMGNIKKILCCHVNKIGYNLFDEYNCTT